jgi:hypothetical protein
MGGKIMEPDFVKWIRENMPLEMYKRYLDYNDCSGENGAGTCDCADNSGKNEACACSDCSCKMHSEGAK